MASVSQAAVAQLGVPGQDLLLGGSEDAVETAEDGEREDHVLVLPAFEAVADEVRDVPDEADDFGVGHLDSLGVVPSTQAPPPRVNLMAVPPSWLGVPHIPSLRCSTQNSKLYITK